MPKFEVIVKTVSEVYYLVDAPNANEARSNWARGEQTGEFVDTEDVIDVYPWDTRFDDDPLTDEYEIEQEETDE